MISSITTKVVADGIPLVVRRMGRGAPVVCLAGIAHDSHDYDAFAERTSDHYEIICIDWPGHGDSFDDDQPASNTRYGELLVKALDQLGLDDPILIGNSIGGGAAVRYAAKRYVRGLVLCDSNGLIEVTPFVRRVCRIFQWIFAAGERGAFWFRPFFWVYYHVVLTQPAAAAQRSRIIAGAPEKAKLLRQAWESFSEPSSSVVDIAASLDVPIWVAWAKSDWTIPLSFCLPAIKRMKTATLTTFKGGHTPFLEQPDAFAKAFLDFAAGLPSSGSARKPKSGSTH